VNHALCLTVFHEDLPQS